MLEQMFRELEKLQLKLVSLKSHRTFNETCLTIYIYTSFLPQRMCVFLMVIYLSIEYICMFFLVVICLSREYIIYSVHNLHVFLNRNEERGTMGF